MKGAAAFLIFTSVLAHGQPRLPAAEQAYEQELKVHPAAAETWQRLGLVRHLQNKFEAAIPAFRNAIRFDPSLWTSHLFLGICLYRTNRFHEALASLDQADRAAPKQHAGRDEIDFWLGATRIAAKQPLKGLQSIERLLARNPKHVEALELSVQTYADLSSAAWNQVAENHFDTAAGYEVHAHALESEGNIDGALEAFRVSRTLNLSRAGPGLGIGRLLLRQKKYEEAFRTFEQEMKLPGADPATYYYAGLAALQLSRYPEAASLMQTASRWARKNPEAPLALAQVYLALKEPAKAAAAARQAVEIAPSSPAAHEILLTALLQAGERESAEAERNRWQQRPAK